ncbi:HAD-IC family P-type ATPase [Capillimicrobium parvum]|uniref:Calcium-transporting ATPase CtpE n=1 Tax=Capillimicrobium parvum TaxID=2884022 RepID=A0A9E7C079_9ACTN|nr:HAD-IC family P-type ATPase [Capillimicrobium parvum]UGS35113.1 Calcium-transporting ATPase CtpE [Capillimicrobium parvum]
MTVATPPLPVPGLTEEEAARRLAARGPLPKPPTSRSYASIVRANTLTVFNAILAVFGVLTLVFGEWKDALFLGVLVANTGIGIGQEVRAKRALDRLAALVAPAATVVRSGVARDIRVADVVVGDLVRVKAGDQIVADGTLTTADGLALDESMLTGESEPVPRVAGDPALSGSFAVEGAGAYEVTAVGADSHAERVAGEARAFRHPRSPLERAMDRVLLVLVGVMAPLAVALVVSLLVRDKSIGDSVQTATAGIVNMVPEGLILLASLTAVVAATRMASRGALTQQLNAVESLASVDLLCTDKTGTLTEATLRIEALVPAAGVSEEELARALGRYAASAPARNGTLEAIAAARLGAADGEAEPVEAQVPFSSARRWSALVLGGETLVLGAPERFDLADLAEPAARHSERGRRVLAIGATEEPLPEITPDAPPPPGVRPLGLVVLAERLRPDTEQTVAFFAEEGVELRVLSGDAPPTVAAIARDAGIPSAGPPLNGGALPEDEAQLRERLLETAVVGRISPEGKRRVVTALADAGRYVGMIGDGVNDVPALKAARLAIAQGSGTQMAKSVADVVLVRGDFAAVPTMVREGRQILRNLQRVARLFVTKSVFAGFLIVALGLTTATYPLLPRHFTLASSLTIGIPAFVLALMPSSGPWRPDRFLPNVLRFSVPAGLGIGIGILAGYLLARYAFGVSLDDARTVSTIVVVLGGLATVLMLESGANAEDTPLGRKRRLAVYGLCALMLAVLVLAIAIPFLRDFYILTVPDGDMLAATAAGAAIGIGLALVGIRLTGALRPDTG